jgi:hypothetical protein
MKYKFYNDVIAALYLPNQDKTFVWIHDVTLYTYDNYIATSETVILRYRHYEY